MEGHKSIIFQSITNCIRKFPKGTSPPLRNARGGGGKLPPLAKKKPRPLVHYYVFILPDIFTFKLLSAVCSQIVLFLPQKYTLKILEIKKLFLSIFRTF